MTLRDLRTRFIGPFTPSRLVPNRFVWLGLSELARGARTRRPAGFGAGLALALFGYLRSRDQGGGELLFVKRIKQDQGLTIRVVRGDEVTDSVDV
ncbi:MAG: hypothetical protein KJP12_06395 [Acidimicrobiia bacterium]|nr:hypothetical protein [Acidimicrobiia bacterium]MBT8214838.1 hypothetical protein [Acidimicrobiia bacterium]NNF68626.1 hypothetical protein [Acidimicrobiia bacterium]NNK91117.1 hypothetical protein [Acidimicrobiia bacterium]